jgi:bifunctional DNA-binding transcriptional regulator/antitoxin component of YhaV-PrlF toxin-antitoxin module
MTYTTILTSKGTTTIPVEIRKELGILPGKTISFEKDPVSGFYIIRPTQSIQELRKKSREILIREGTLNRPYESGDGFTAHVMDGQGVS